MRSSASASPAIERHPPVTRALHWATAVILVVSVSAILYRETTEQKTVRQVLMELHRQLGLLVLLILVARVAVRSVKGLVNHAPGLSAGVRRAATLAHWSMYGVLAGLSLLGWARSRANDSAQAIAYYEQSLPFSRRAGDRSELGYTLDGVGSILYESGRVRAALQTYKEALDIRRQLKDRRAEGCRA